MKGGLTTMSTTPQPHVAAHRIAERAKGGPVKVVDHRGSGLNARIGLKITLVVGTMWCAYLFTLLALVSAPSAFKSGNSIIIVAWIAQTFLQLVLLPIIIVGQNVQAKAADARSEQTFHDTEAILHALDLTTQGDLTEVLNAIKAIPTQTCEAIASTK